MKYRITAALFVILLINSGYLLAYPSASLFYMANAVAHLAVGLFLMVAAVRVLKLYPWEGGTFLCAGVAALLLVARGNTLDHRAILWLHIGLGAVAALLVSLRFRRALPILVPAFGLPAFLPDLMGG